MHHRSSRGPKVVDRRRGDAGSNHDDTKQYGSNKVRIARMAPKLLLMLLLVLLIVCIGYYYDYLAGTDGRPRQKALRTKEDDGSGLLVDLPLNNRNDPKAAWSGQNVEEQNGMEDEQQPPVSSIAAEASGEGFQQENGAKQKNNKKELAWKTQDGSWVGYVRIPNIAPGERTADDGKLHILFSSGCNHFQHWQSELLLASAVLVGQRGRITRIVSGCSDKRAETVQHRSQTFPGGKNDLLVPLPLLNRSVHDDFGLYITPAFDGARDFPWINKPSSMDFFMHHARDELDRLGETVVAILDPDFVFVTPLITQTAGAYIATRGHDTLPGVNSPPNVVQKGRPVAQRYGLEGGWVNPNKYDLTNITGEAHPVAANWSASDAAKWTSVGPPLMLHVDDLSELSPLWARYMRPVLQVGSDILADMWAYSIAAAQLDLKHTILDHYMISSWGHRGEAYEWIDEWKTMSCRNPRPEPGYKSPTFIHMASNFKAPQEDGPWMFHKGHVPAAILDCDTPLIKESPDDLFDVTEGRTQRQRAWTVCNIVSRLNKVLLMYKQKFCPAGFEQRKLVRLIQDKTVDRGCNEHKQKWCFPLAQIEDLPEGWRDQ